MFSQNASPAAPSRDRFGMVSHRAIVLAVFGGSMAAAGAPAQERPVQLDPIRVESETPTTRPLADGYKAEYSQSPKYTAPLIDTPHSVTVITSDVMRDSGAVTMTDALRTTPGITLGSGEGGNPMGDRPFIRGFDSMGSTFVDGIRDTGSQSRETFNLEQVEVSKGPGSAFTGRGSAGGSINLITKAPQARNFVEGSATLGTDFTKRLTADGNYMISDNAALRLNVMAHDADVAGRDEVHVQRWGVAPSLALGLGGPTRMTLSLYHMQSDDIPDYGHPYDPNRGHPASVDRDNFYGLTNRDFRETQVDSATLRLEHDVNDRLTLRNTTRYSWSENDYIVTNPDDSRGNVPNGFVWRSVKSRNSDTETFTNQTEAIAEFETARIKHKLLTGVEVGVEDSKNRGYAVDTGSSACVAIAPPYNCTSLFSPNPDDPWTGSIGPSGNGTENEVLTKAVYALDTLELSPSWLLNLGLRYDDYHTTRTGGLVNDSQFLNYQLGVVYKPAANGSIYIAYGTSSTPPGSTAGEGADNISSSDANLEPEQATSYEIGTKWDVLENRLSLNAAMFRNEKTNARVALAPGRGAPEDTIGEELIHGFEVGFAGNITRKWKVFGGYMFLDSEIVDDGPVNSNEGNRFPNTPAHSFSLWTNYQVTPEFSVGGGAFFIGHQYGNAANDKEIPSYWRFDATGAYKLNERVRFQLTVLNLLDETYYDKAYTTHMASVAPGRSALITANLKF